MVVREVLHNFLQHAQKWQYVLILFFLAVPTVPHVPRIFKIFKIIFGAYHNIKEVANQWWVKQSPIMVHLKMEL